MNLLLAIETSQWVLFALLIAILIIAPILMSLRNKKEMAKAQQVMDSLKKGDKILTSAGVIGKVVGIEEKDGYKTVTIETGDEKHKGYMTVDIAAIYMNLSAPVEPVQQKEQKEEKKAKTEPEATAEENVEEHKMEEKTEDVVSDNSETEKSLEEPKTEESETPKKKKSSKKTSK